MVPYRMVRLEKDIFPYRKGEKWADPDVQEAAHFLRKLADDPDYRAKISEAAYEYVREKLGREQVITKIRRQLDPVFLPEDGQM